MAQKASRRYQSESVAAGDFLAKHPQPVVLFFQPTQFTILQDPSELKQWEADLVERVGLRGFVGKNIAEELIANGGTCCESGDTNDCDQD